MRYPRSYHWGKPISLGNAQLDSDNRQLGLTPKTDGRKQTPLRNLII